METIEFETAKKFKETFKRIIKNINTAFKEINGFQDDYLHHVKIINAIIYAIAQESDRLENRIKKLEEKLTLKFLEDMNNGKK